MYVRLKRFLKKYLWAMLLLCFLVGLAAALAIAALAVGSILLVTAPVLAIFIARGMDSEDEEPEAATPEVVTPEVVEEKPKATRGGPTCLNCRYLTEQWTRDGKQTWCCAVLSPHVPTGCTAFQWKTFEQN